MSSDPPDKDWNDSFKYDPTLCGKDDLLPPDYRGKHPYSKKSKKRRLVDDERYQAFREKFQLRERREAARNQTLVMVGRNEYNQPFPLNLNEREVIEDLLADPFAGRSVSMYNMEILQGCCSGIQSDLDPLLGCSQQPDLRQFEPIPGCSTHIHSSEHRQFQPIQGCSKQANSGFATAGCSREIHLDSFSLYDNVMPFEPRTGTSTAMVVEPTPGCSKAMPFEPRPGCSKDVMDTKYDEKPPDSNAGPSDTKRSRYEEKKPRDDFEDDD